MASLLLTALVSLPWPAASQGPPTAPPTPPARPELAFEDSAAVVSGIHAKGQVAWFSVAREIADDWATIVRREDVAEDTDGDGVVRFDLDRPVPLKSIWVAVDLTTGEYALGTPEGFPLQQLDLPGRGLGRAASGPEWVESPGQFAEVLIVRPGAGAWGMTAGDGGEGDEGARGDRRVTVSLPRFHGVRATAAAPERYSPRDLVFSIDPDLMKVYVGQVAEPSTQP
jgi:hypothetical protein